MTRVERPVSRPISVAASCFKWFLVCSAIVDVDEAAPEPMSSPAHTNDGHQANGDANVAIGAAVCAPRLRRDRPSASIAHGPFLSAHVN